MAKKKPKVDKTDLVDIQSKKRVAADGTQRGLHRKGQKSKATSLLEQCQAEALKRHKIENWDPVVMLTIIGNEAYMGYPAVDDDGNPVIDEVTGKQVMVPPNKEFAAAVFAKAAPFLHGHVKPKEHGDDDERGGDPEALRDEALAALENMGVKVQRDE